MPCLGYNGAYLSDFLYASVSGSLSWTVVSAGYGDNGVYPTNPGDPEASNIHPGLRMQSATATQYTAYGTILWLFGGYANGNDGVPGLINDVWYYNTSTGNWRWVSGPKTTSTPVADQPSPRTCTHAWFHKRLKRFVIVGGEGSI